MKYWFKYIAILSQLVLQINAIRYGYRSETVPSLCDDPEVYAADRLVNNTVRLYRGDYYWELKGIPGKKGFLDGPHKIRYQDFKTVTKNTGLVTILSGSRKGCLTRFEGQRWYGWQPNGYQGNGDHGVTTQSIPKGGFKAVFHNGNQTDPMLIGLESIKVYYYNTKIDIYGSGMQFVGNSDGYMGGQFGENFPPDITAAFSYPSTDPSDGYLIYMFKNNKYCYRAAYRKDSTKSCDEWRLSRELFGCDESSQPGGSQHTPGESNPAIESDSNILIAVSHSIVLPIIFFFVNLYLY